VPTKESLVALGTSRGRRLVAEFGRELRNARLAAGLSQARVATAAGISQPTVSRFEAGVRPYPDFVQASRVARLVGLDLRMRCFAAAGQLRDAAHVRLMGRCIERLPPSVTRQLEAPVAPGDPRAWGALLTVEGVRISVAAETRIRDLQALLRREHLKATDGRVDRLLLLASNTRHNRAALAEAASLLAEALPLGTRACMSALERGRAPSGSGVVII
jgi:transcriptional regulator with XRE-family HTH domain